MLRNRPGSYFAGVLGWPLENSLSPVLHNAAFRRLGIDWVYFAWPVPPDQLEAAAGGLRALGAMGANVTMPHKETIVPLLDGLSVDAEGLGAVNTIQRVGDKLIGHNTDVDGFRLSVEDAGARIEGVDAVVLGAGGAARAVVRALTSMGAATVTVTARRPEQAEGILASAPGARVAAWDEAAALVTGCPVVINCTPVGMAGEDLLPEASFRPGQFVFDLIYDPPSTPFVERARFAGADAWGGINMLVHQAAESFRIWTGSAPPLDVMSAAAVHAVGRR